MKILDDATRLSVVDSKSMIGHLVNFPDQCKDATEIGESISVPFKGRDISNVVVAGLGGSAIGGDLLRVYLKNEAPVPILVVRDYRLPAFVGPDTLVLASSYSGNTEETLSTYEDARARGAMVVSITSGGRLSQLSREDNTPVVTIPGGYPPRATLGYSFIPMLTLLSKIGIAGDKSQDLAEVRQLMEQKRDAYGPAVSTEENPAKQLAETLKGKLPLVYSSSDPLEVVSLRWKGQFSENGKVLSYQNVLPELNHNEIVGWEAESEIRKNIQVVLLRDKDEHPRVQRRAEITSSIVRPLAAGLTEVWSEGDSLLARLFSLIYLGDFVSVYVAVLNGIDPTPVKSIDYLKERMAEA